MSTGWLFKFEVYSHYVSPCLGISVSGQLVPLWRVRHHNCLHGKR
jgi:hypothetical protein